MYVPPLLISYHSSSLPTPLTHTRYTVTFPLPHIPPHSSVHSSSLYPSSLTTLPTPSYISPHKKSSFSDSYPYILPRFFTPLSLSFNPLVITSTRQSTPLHISHHTKNHRFLTPFPYILTRFFPPLTLSSLLTSPHTHTPPLSGRSVATPSRYTLSSHSPTPLLIPLLHLYYSQPPIIPLSGRSVATPSHYAPGEWGSMGLRSGD